MNANPDRIFPLCGGSPERLPLRAPRLLSTFHLSPGFVMGHRAFLRDRAGRKLATAAADANAAAAAPNPAPPAG